MKKIICILISLFIITTNLFADEEKPPQIAKFDILSELDLEIIQNIRMLENLETLENIKDADFELLENLEFIESMNEGEEEIPQEGDKDEQ